MTHSEGIARSARGEVTARTYDRIHVGANIPQERHLELFRLLKPGGLLVGPMGDRMVRLQVGVLYVSRARRGESRGRKLLI
jgi:protein-L-isoaspartate O-methyltransferase